VAFEPRNILERSLVRAMQDPAHRPRFYRDFLKADVYAIQQGPVPARATRQRLQEGTRIQLVVMEIEGRKFIPIFSSVQRISAVIKEPVAYMGVNTEKLLKMTRGEHVILNPGSECGKKFGRDEITALLDGSLFQPERRRELPAGTQVVLGEPARRPDELVAALSRLFERTPQVTRAFLAHFLDPSSGEKSHTLVAIDVTGEFHGVAAAADMVCRYVEVPDPPVDFVQLTGRTGVEDYFRDKEPFYRKGG
jgi:hypothetical protein